MHVLWTDVETVGLDPDDNPVIEVGFAHYNGEEMISEFQVKMRPWPDWADEEERDRVFVSLGALKCNGLSYSELQELGSRNVAVQQIVDYLLSVIKKVGRKKLKLGGHNVAFDIQRIRELLEEHNITNWGEVFDYSFIDTSVIGNFLRDTKVITLDIMSLENLAEVLGLEPDKNKVHTALYDTHLSAKAYFAMKKLGQRARRKDDN